MPICGVLEPFVETIVLRAKALGSAVDAGTWRRYFTVVLDGLRSEPGAATALPGRALTGVELDSAKAAMHRRRR